MVFEHLIKDDQISSDAQQQSEQSKNDTGLRIPDAIRALIPPPTPMYHAMTQVNRCMLEEFLQIYSQNAIFRFTLDASHAESASFWKVPDHILSSMRTVRLKVLANPGIVGEFDPRRETGSWNLRDRVFGLIDRMEKLEDLRLSIQAVGNQLWNPIWLWHYTSQAFKVSEVKAFKRMSFDLEGWNVREPNHLERNENGLWEWRCAENHYVLSDTDGPQPIRSFCAALYAECRICHPTEGSDTED
jgi:hypothetical protein